MCEHLAKSSNIWNKLCKISFSWRFHKVPTATESISSIFPRGIFWSPIWIWFSLCLPYTAVVLELCLTGILGIAFHFLPVLSCLFLGSLFFFFFLDLLDYYVETFCQVGTWERAQGSNIFDISLFWKYFYSSLPLSWQYWWE